MGGSSKADYVAFSSGNTLALEVYKVTRGAKGRDPLFVDANEAKTLASRGSFLPVIMGRRKIEPLFAWVGGRNTNVSTQRAGGKGGGGGTTGGPQTTTYSEEAWHLLCVGPARQLHRIHVSGKIVWEGPISQDDSPSGTSITVPSVGTFTIYWGETGQPVNAFLGDSNRVGVTSRWPGACYVVWEDFQLGGQPSWPIVSYDVETEIVDAILSGSPSGSENVPGPGVNIAHAISQVLFAPFPRGLARDQSHYDMASLENLGISVSSPSSGYLPNPINAALVFNYDAGAPDSITADVNGYVDGWKTLGAFTADPGVTVAPVAPNRRPVYYDGEGVVPQGLVDRGQSLKNACPGLYFNSSHNTILTCGPNAFTALLSGTDEIGLVAAITLYGVSEGGAGGSAGRVGAILGLWEDPVAPPADPSEAGLIPSDAQGIHLAAGASLAGSIESAFFRSSVVEDSSPAPNEIGFVQTEVPIPSVTVIAALRYSDLGGGSAAIELTVSTLNGGVPFVTVTTAVKTSLNRLVIGGFRDNLTQIDYYADAVVHQVIGLTGPVLQVDIDTYIEWLRRRWGSCSKNPDSRAFATNAISLNGNSAGDLLGDLLRDGSIGMRWNMQIGKFQFIPFRANSAVTIVPEGYITGTPPQISSEHGKEFSDRTVFSFVDVKHGFQKQTITVDSDGVADLETFAKAKEINLPTVVDFDSAESVSNRRLLEEQGTSIKIVVELNHEGRIYAPGNVLSLPSFPDLVRVVELALTKRSQGRTGNARLTCIPDVYGAEEYFYFSPATGTGSDTGQPIPPAPDVAFGIFELPEKLQPPGTPIAIVPRVRANPQIGYASIYLSDDGLGYASEGQEFGFQVGGTLDGPLAQDTRYLLDTGPTITIQGVPDISVLEDLTAQPSLWRGGDQLALIVDEVFFVRALTPLGGLTFRLDGLIRARFDTVRQAHLAGAQVFLLRLGGVLPLANSILLQPDNQIFTKTQPVASFPLDLALVSSETRTLYGKGTRPAAPSELRIQPHLSRSYVTGESPQFAWNYLTNGAGAGTVLAGTPHTPPPPDMTFELEIWDAGDTTLLRLELLGAATSYSYSNGDLSSDLGGEVSFIAKVFSRRSGYRSSSHTAAISKV